MAEHQRLPVGLKSSVAFLSACLLLTSLGFARTGRITVVSGLSTLTALEFLDISSCKFIVNLGSFNFLVCLVTPGMEDCHAAVDLGNLTECTSLQCLRLQGPLRFL